MILWWKNSGSPNSLWIRMPNMNQFHTNQSNIFIDTVEPAIWRQESQFREDWRSLYTSYGQYHPHSALLWQPLFCLSNPEVYPCRFFWWLCYCCRHNAAWELLNCSGPSTIWRIGPKCNDGKPDIYLQKLTGDGCISKSYVWFRNKKHLVFSPKHLGPDCHWPSIFEHVCQHLPESWVKFSECSRRLLQTPHPS